MNVLIELANNGINIAEIITAIYTDEGFAKRLGKTSSWRLQLASIDNTIDDNSHVYYEGNDIGKMLSLIQENWGTWVITEVPDDDNTTGLEVFGIELKKMQHTIKRVYVIE